MARRRERKTRCPFISHYVQIKQQYCRRKGFLYYFFISHYVQIKRSLGRETMSLKDPLYPTTFK